jgi:hypothetical protein
MCNHLVMFLVPWDDPRISDQSVDGRDIWIYRGDVDLSNYEHEIMTYEFSRNQKAIEDYGHAMGKEIGIWIVNYPSHIECNPEDILLDIQVEKNGNRLTVCMDFQAPGRPVVRCIINRDEGELSTSVGLIT